MRERLSVQRKPSLSAAHPQMVRPTISPTRTALTMAALIAGGTSRVVGSPNWSLKAGRAKKPVVTTTSKDLDFCLLMQDSPRPEVKVLGFYLDRETTYSIITTVERRTDHPIAFACSRAHFLTLTTSLRSGDSLTDNSRTIGSLFLVDVLDQESLLSD